MIYLLVSRLVAIVIHTLALHMMKSFGYNKTVLSPSPLIVRISPIILVSRWIGLRNRAREVKHAMSTLSTTLGSVYGNKISKKIPGCIVYSVHFGNYHRMPTYALMTLQLSFYNKVVAIVFQVFESEFVNGGLIFSFLKSYWRLHILRCHMHYNITKGLRCTYSDKVSLDAFGLNLLCLR